MKKQDKSRIAEALGASRVVEVGPKTIGGPLDLLACVKSSTRVYVKWRAAYGSRLDGHPTRAIQGGQLDATQDLASEIGVSGSRMGPAQVAALLIESSLEEIEEGQWQEALEASRSAPLRPSPKPPKRHRSLITGSMTGSRAGGRSAGRQGHERSYGAVG